MWRPSFFLADPSDTPTKIRTSLSIDRLRRAAGEYAPPLKKAMNAAISARRKAQPRRPTVQRSCTNDIADWARTERSAVSLAPVRLDPPGGRLHVGYVRGASCEPG